ncbi:HD superfamily phosphodiesterase [Actinopolyspora biskrensis]|uniref:HD superfamily phosphodiesterase n=1 Tax=Actinopolyspora biskrensis TaxID=1470178 RepID=A0A852Z0Y3_9ACTN|nr:hypothetical protein [Actinopolyspora biskrensis]NYH80158.1 HD superfamily phosphodiesterase [Actinopolyspora biskrensis]
MLDEIGAIGIARAFMYGGSTGEPMRVATEQLQTVYPGGRTSSVVLRFHEKPLRLREETSTSSGKREAERRHQPVLRFPQFLHEEHGDLDTAPAHRFEDAL